ncbi:hypothetical protein FGO68_gene6684 [Halteria grandinella]|uniref:Uncharacterized protein n=1 Tax=Halteria grandinella TaxID=5974 RepID=A0A8J8NTH9_HALGN|nr:hypothetical protein FGO68_gene6684 [Halteria grandinella]
MNSLTQSQIAQWSEKSLFNASKSRTLSSLSVQSTICVFSEQGSLGWSYVNIRDFALPSLSIYEKYSSKEGKRCAFSILTFIKGPLNGINGDMSFSEGATDGLDRICFSIMEIFARNCFTDAFHQSFHFLYRV